MKYAWIDAHRDSYPVARMCRLLSVARTGYLQWRVRPPSPRRQANVRLGMQLQAIHVASDRSYGRPRLLRALREQGERIGGERVRRLMHEHGLRSVHRKPYRVTTNSKHDHPIAPNVVARQFVRAAPDQVWLADISYIATDEGWLYLAAVLDGASRRIVGWSMSDRLKATLTCDALRMAYWRRKPEPGLIVHSDRGVQYACRAYRTLVEQFRMTQSMSRRGNVWDNAPMESFFKTLKTERADRRRYRSRDEARRDLMTWIEGIYNAQRLHSAIGYRSPAQYERLLRAA